MRYLPLNSFFFGSYKLNDGFLHRFLLGNNLKTFERFKFIFSITFKVKTYKVLFLEMLLRNDTLKHIYDVSIADFDNYKNWDGFIQSYPVDIYKIRFWGHTTCPGSMGFIYKFIM